METPKRFNNTPNGRIRLQYQFKENSTELDYWIHRAPAVVGVIFAIPAIGGMLVLVTKRSNKMRDEANKYGVPCGYIDWDETGYEGMMREVYEETSLYLPDYSDLVISDNNKQPFLVKDNPKSDKRQNVSLLYLTVLDFSKQMDRFPFDVEKFVCHETAWVKWMNITEFYMKYQEMEWAFNHDETIKNAVIFNNKNY